MRMGSNDLKTWVSDKLMVLLGYSEKSVVDYLILKGKFDAFSLWSTFFCCYLDNLQVGMLLFFVQLKNQNHQLKLLEC